MSPARELDEALARVARGEGALDLGLGETLDALFAGGRLLEAGYATERDYARERLGLPPRTMYDALALGRVCAGRPLLRKAVASALVSPCKARAIAPVVGGNEPGWTALAMTSTLREVRAAVRAAGKEPPLDFESESLRLRMSPAQQDRLDEALALAAETLGGGVPRWQCLEAISQEWLSEHGEWAPEEGGAGGPEPPAEAKPLPECVTEHLAAIAEAKALVEDKAPVTKDPKELDARAMRFVAARRGYDLAFGPLALRVVDGRVWAAVGYPTLEEYCLERLGMAPSALRQRVWLERRMFALPALREALRSGILTYSKALLVAQDATPETVADLIAKAAGTTWQQTDREATAREDRRNRAKGLRRLWAPKDVAKTVVAAILSAQRWSASEGRRIDAGEALALISDHFVAVWSRHRGKRPSGGREEVLRRNGGRCSVPGCSLPARHIHHVRYKSHGGTDDAWNIVSICVPHHLRGIHHGHLTVEGRAGERLVWRFGNGEVFVTNGDDDVSRADADCVAEGRPPAYNHHRRPREEVPIGSAA
jgi:hypothetical protein